MVKGWKGAEGAEGLYPPPPNLRIPVWDDLRFDQPPIVSAATQNKRHSSCLFSLSATDKCKDCLGLPHSRRKPDDSKDTKDGIAHARAWVLARDGGRLLVLGDLVRRSSAQTLPE